jgi:hypothetical protein
MSKRRPATPAKQVINDTIVVEPNGVQPVSQSHPAASTEHGATDAKLLAYIHDERHFSFLRYFQFIPP